MTAALEHCDALVDVFTEVTHDCALNDLIPVAVRVARYPSGGIECDVHFLTSIAAVDTLADAHGFGPDCTPESQNYTREGRLDIDGHAVTVRIFTGRPASDGAVTS